MGKPRGLQAKELHVTVSQDDSGGGWWYPVRLVNGHRSLAVRQFTSEADAMTFANKLGDFLGVTVR